MDHSDHIRVLGRQGQALSEVCYERPVEALIQAPIRQVSQHFRHLSWDRVPDVPLILDFGGKPCEVAHVVLNRHLHNLLELLDAKLLVLLGRLTREQGLHPLE